MPCVRRSMTLAKPRLALLHGWGMHPGVFDPLAERLAADFDIMLPCLPGHGGTPPVATGTLESWARALADALPADTVLVGWSLGGQVALRVALQWPTRVARLVLLATTPRFVAAPDWAAGLAAGELAAFGDALLREPRATLLRFLSLQTRGAPNARTLLAALRRGVQAAPPPDPGALAQGLDLLLTTDLRSAWPTLVQPVQIIHGGRDALTPPGAARWLAQTRPGARLALLDAAAHAPHLSHPDAVAAIIRGFANG